VTGPPAAERPTGLEYLRLVLLGACVGIPAAFLAALFLAAVHGLEQVLWHDIPKDIGVSSPPWYLVITFPVVGAAICLAARRLLPGDGGHDPLLGLNKAPTPVSHVPGVVLAALATLSFGAVLGPEAPILAIGTAVGVAITMFVKIGPQGNAVISLAGGFSGLSALFEGPIVAGMFLVESSEGLGAALPPLLVPGLVSAAVGYTIFIGFGHWGGLNAPGLTVPNLPTYTGTHVDGLVIALVVGVVTALLLTYVHQLGVLVQATGLKRLGMPVLLLAGGVVVGLLAEFADLLGANSQNVLFSGQTSIPAIVTATSTKIVLITVVAKALAYGVSLGCGFRGGPIFPAIFLGVALTSLCVVWFNTSPTLAIAVGAAAGMAAQTRLLVTPPLLAVLLVGRAGLQTIPAAVLTTVAAWLTLAALDSRAQKRDPAAPSGN
jgi:H+/Cl- antiporter ClcA